MSGNECPHCRGDLVDNIPHSVWIITFSTLTSVAAGLDTSTFELSGTLDSGSAFDESLASTSGVVSGSRTVYSWTLSSIGSPATAKMQVEHDTLGTLTHTLQVSEQSAAA